MMHAHSTSSLPGDVIFAIPFGLAIAAYATGVALQHHRGRSWPWFRTAAWTSGVLLIAATFLGPFAAAAHEDFVAHMGAHLLVGMAGPLLLVLSAPVTLALRSLHVSRARRLSRLLRSLPAQVISTPVVAAVLNVGGLWLLYTSGAYALLEGNPLLHLVVSIHFLLAGLLFTAAIIPIDPAPHRTGFGLRAGVLLAAMAAHSILAKWIYAHPPLGVGAGAAEAGAMLMYYAGGLVDGVIVLVLCAQWYRHVGRSRARGVRLAAAL
ncbi:cytochrome c oxidase assembly protein [Microbacterium sp. ET2]|uniref:cytochrome c oxidase assembly protein n=1 Tax=Microbacterium albipurpureum TaxID=3050384 RepID=UPI00259CCF45|nr:cytochrome c oxidase assembly protein [Microbacterium sp. ET2 (Ac-2212)]WJL94924.1 cytochrome c oxidase assembly protein [Microbacterium sp. ET2 (Ac-2212)]